MTSVRIEIPADKVDGLLFWYDQWQTERLTGGGYAAQHTFWRDAAEVCPETATGRWALDMSDPLRPCFKSVGHNELRG